MDPLVSSWCSQVVPQQLSAFAAAEGTLEKVTPEGLKLLHGFSHAALLPSGKAPALRDLDFTPGVHLVVSRVPPQAQSPGPVPAFASLMLHGWLFHAFAASDRKAHQKFPLLSIHDPDNVVSAPAAALEAPAWLPTNGSFGWADQHVHRDEPVDLGGFLFAEVFFGSDMARVGVADPKRPASLWAVAVDSEESKGLVTFVVLLPEVDPDIVGEITDVELDALLRGAKTVAEVATALRKRYGACAEKTASSIDNLIGEGEESPE